MVDTNMEEKKTNLRENKTAKLILRIIGFIFTISGLACMIIAFIDFFSHIGLDSGMPTKFFLFYIGAPLLFIGIVCLGLGFMKAVTGYVAS
jgi:uncharacterized membrane protein